MRVQGSFARNKGLTAPHRDFVPKILLNPKQTGFSAGKKARGDGYR